MCDSAVTTAAAATIRRHNSLSVITPNKLLPSSSKPPIRSSSLDLELLLLKSSPVTSYTSLKDLLSPNVAVNSPTASFAAINSGYEISIRNRLVKQAARAYLQPMASSVGNSSPRNSFHRIVHCLSSNNSLVDCFKSLVSGFTRIFYRILHAFRGQVRT
ncbi:hypothetical protein TSUD_340200 [Trifolium subterraneum]|uniref:Uncharacterized protein n=1 Tax=Trifolium subterraneum TaxID=3900 RepID=A0A2Z6LND0_TRISU|nr:hypothetical protein TSUD_340200 [Trifolium subterraneum]